MSAPGFTPGPWKADADDKLNPDRSFGIVAPWRDGDSEGTVVIAEVTSAETEEQARRDADLLAAAPDLYAALREMVECEDAAENHPEGWEALFERFAYALQDARAALAKAEGRQA